MNPACMATVERKTYPADAVGFCVKARGHSGPHSGIAPIDRKRLYPTVAEQRALREFELELRGSHES